jgi:hypothetical protein
MCSINHDLKAIFIHIPKTAGTYLADVLHKYYGFKNYYLTRPDHKEFCGSFDNSIKSHENKIHGTLMYYKTSAYCNQIMNMTPEKWESYYKFCFIRNPYDKIVSGWNYVNQNKYPFMFYLNKPYKKNSWDYWHVLMPQTRHIINEKGKIGVNFIGLNERLEEDFDKVLNHLGLQNKHRQGKKNVKKHEVFFKYYNQQILNKVNHLLNEDFIHLNQYYKKIDSIQDFIKYYSTNISFLTINNNENLALNLINQSSNDISTSSSSFDIVSSFISLLDTGESESEKVTLSVSS